MFESIDTDTILYLVENEPFKSFKILIFLSIILLLIVVLKIRKYFKNKK
ncbi:hypothetical protein JJB75_16065 [Clostridium perfringens]|nr:hypothetical protein [Clostridium perfringens]MBO3304596.1 hypothetical protein [Clostridium perfringens]MBO3307913.1 hypothetical protein [Clostridium perfringens]MBO3311259.1 hypothetical protein [Clostridium perfringens]MBO3317593.1 hypothetical protein [Clostridium perfringens]MBO3392710.1 hypothetical protein [Clostridium perfringens]